MLVCERVLGKWTHQSVSMAVCPWDFYIVVNIYCLPCFHGSPFSYACTRLANYMNFSEISILLGGQELNNSGEI